MEIKFILNFFEEQCPKVVPSKTVYICYGHALALLNAPKNFPLKIQGFVRSCPVCSFPIPKIDISIYDRKFYLLIHRELNDRQENELLSKILNMINDGQEINAADVSTIARYIFYSPLSLAKKAAVLLI